MAQGNNLQNYPYFVTMTDKFLSGWGGASGKTHKQVYCVKTRRDALEIIAMYRGRKDRDGMRYISIRTTFPAYDTRKYSTTYRNASGVILEKRGIVG